MPYGDGTGPLGTGPIGRGLGPCGRGLRRGYGIGIGWRGYGWRSQGVWGGWWRYNPASYAPISKEEELSILKDEQKYLQEEMDSLKKRIEELGK